MCIIYIIQQSNNAHVQDSRKIKQNTKKILEEFNFQKHKTRWMKLKLETTWVTITVGVHYVEADSNLVYIGIWNLWLN